MRHLRFKRHYKLLLLLLLVVTVLSVGAGDQRIVAYSLQEGGQLTEAIINYDDTAASWVETVSGSVQALEAVQASSSTSPE